MVTWDELPDALSEQLQNHASSSPSCQYMLTVSLLCTDNNNNNNNVSQEILLELAEIHTTYQTTELLLAKRLQWPETIFGMTTEEEEETSQASVVSWFSWFDKLLDKLPHKPRKPQGVVSATLCRRNPSSVNQNQTDALDMIAWMSLGIVNEETAGTTTATATATATTTPASTEVNQPASANNTSTTISTTFTSMLCDLYLCCISSRGLVAIYSPWTLLLDEPPPSSTTTTTTTDPEPLFSDDAMTHFFLGMELSIKLNQIWRPLCQPLTTISLSVLENSTPFHNHKKGQQTNPLWNPFVEPTTLPHRTIHNRLTNIQVAGDSFLVLLGQGKRPKPKNNNDATQDEGLLLRQPSLRRTWWESKRDMSVDFKEALADVDYDDDNDKEEKEEQELQDEMQEQINHPNDFDEETPWWANNSSTGGSGSLSPTPKEKETNPPTTTTSESTSNPTRPTTKPKPNKTTFQEDIPAVSSKLSKPKTTAHEELAGFVTFCSIAHWSETRTFFLPFVPRSVSYIAQFQSMELLLVLGDTEAVAIRMDNPEITSLTVAADASVAGGTILGTTETNVASTTTNTSTQDTVTSIGNNKTIKIRRFQVMPILMNNTDSNDGRLLCAASPSEPPALLQLFSENQQHGLVLHKTLQTITPLGIEMGHAPGHVAKLSCDPQQTESLEGSWAFSGQVRSNENQTALGLNDASFTTHSLFSLF